MKLVKVDEHKRKDPFMVYCIGCNTMNPITTTYADLDGEAFKAYYCLDCTNDIKEREEKKENE